MPAAPSIVHEGCDAARRQRGIRVLVVPMFAVRGGCSDLFPCPHTRGSDDPGLAVPHVPDGFGTHAVLVAQLCALALYPRRPCPAGFCPDILHEFQFLFVNFDGLLLGDDPVAR